MSQVRGALMLSCCSLGLLATSGAAHARATFVVNNLDSPGVGFNDATPAAPVGGNTGTTVGQQRANVFREAANVWGKAIDSSVPIAINAHFGPLACSQTQVALGQARPSGLEANRPGLPPNVFFPEALANRIAEVDLNPGEGDIEATFNGGLGPCTAGKLDWYYGLDGKAPSSGVDLLYVVIHELGHGLGFQSNVDPQTGRLAGGILDTFSSHVFDNAAGQAWSQMTDAQRAASAQNVRHLVWNGPNVLKMAAQVLAKGAPKLSATPAIAGLGGPLGEATYGPRVAGHTVQGRIVVGTPVHGCARAPNYAGSVVLFDGTTCPSAQKVSLAAMGGALAVLIQDPDGVSPPSSIDVPANLVAMFPVQIPILGVTEDDAARLAAAAGAMVTLSSDDARMLGADDQGRPYLYATTPLVTGSTVSHWDPLARPELVMEPNAAAEHSYDLRMEGALMRDIGWTPFCGNGRLDPDEECDAGPANSDTAAGACRTTCFKATCGDGVVDPGEACDMGKSNSNTMPGACRITCMKAACGDGVVDPGEACDTGMSNSNTMSGACRATCVKAACGDGVVDPGETCDMGMSNSNTVPGACRSTCKPAACGDGVIDMGEACDDGTANGTGHCLATCQVADTGGGCGCSLDGRGAASVLATAAFALLAAWTGRSRRRRRRA